MALRIDTSTEAEATGFFVDTMTEHDLLEVVEIEESCGLSLWGWEAYRSELSRPESIMLVARSATRFDASQPMLHGFIAARIYDHEIHINNIGVRMAVRRRGIGGELLGTVLRIGERCGAREAILEVRAGNTSAQALYEAFGFIVRSRREGYYRDPGEDALVMTRECEAMA